MNQQNDQPPPRRSRRLATFIPASHWISVGYSQVDAQLMEKLQNDMKKYCGSDDTVINLHGNVSSYFNDIEVRGNVPPLPHHDMMLPHWQRLAKGLNGRTSINSLSLIGISLPASVLDIMFPVLQSINLEKFGIISVGLGRDGYLKLSSFIRDNTSIKTLGIGGERIDDLSIATSLSDAVKGHPNLKELGVIRSGLNDANILGKVLEGCTGIRELRLAYEEEKLGLESMTIMADFIRSNHPMKFITMRLCNITDTEIIILASALKENSNLIDLDLNENDITEEGENTLLEVLFDPTSMDSIVESNHLCKVYTYDYKNPSIVAQRPPLEQELFDINRGNYTVGEKIRKKVVLALCGVDGSLFDLSHLNDLPLQLMPRVLELIQEHTRTRTTSVKVCRNMPGQLEKDALSRLFHTLRGWELPLLFENLSPKKGEVEKRKRKRRKNVVDIGRRVDGRRLRNTKLLIRYCIFTSVHSYVHFIYTSSLPVYDKWFAFHLYHEAQHY